MTALEPKPDTRTAVDFLKLLTPDDRWDLAAIPPDGGKPRFRTFHPDQYDRAFDWIDAHQGKAGLYYHVNRLRDSARNIKAKKPDIVAVRALHVDVDINDEATLSALRAFTPKPTIIVFSGGGYQALWRLAGPSTEFDRAERVNIWIAQQLGGDNCHNIDRLLRLPGTINMPNAKKRAAGRVPVLARVVE
jgi:hypothetical protein